MSVRWLEIDAAALIAGAAILPCGALTALALRRSRNAVFGSLVVTMVLFVWVVAGFALPRLDEERVVKRIGLLARGSRGLPAYSYSFAEPGLAFYARRTVTRIDSPRDVARLARARPGFALVAREGDLPLLLQEIPGRDVSVVVERGFCEAKGPLGLVLLRRRPADARSHG
jgi:hypothetical protein